MKINNSKSALNNAYFVNNSFVALNIFLVNSHVILAISLFFTITDEADSDAVQSFQFGRISQD